MGGLFEVRSKFRAGQKIIKTIGGIAVAHAKLIISVCVVGITVKNPIEIGDSF